MSLPVFFFAPAAETAVGEQVTLDGPEAHHAASVRRLRPTEQVMLTDGRGTGVTAEVLEVGRRALTCRVISTEREPDQPLMLTVVQALAKGERSDLAVELLTEVGVDRLVPWQASRSVSRWRDDKVARGLAKWRSTAAEAAKQSRRLRWPVVEDMVEGDGVVDLIREATASYVLHESAPSRLAHVVTTEQLPREGEVMLVVGPEGGIDEAELAAFSAMGAQPVRLGQTVLRTSTAGVVAASLVLGTTTAWRSRLGDDERTSP